MPEGPEIRRVAMRLNKILTGRIVEDVWFGQPPLRKFAVRLRGREVHSVASRSKALLTAFEGGLTIYSHNQLYGKWYVVRRGREPGTGRTLRVALHTATHSALLYSASDIAVLDAAGLAEQPYLARLGPEALDANVTWQEIAGHLRSRAFRGRQLSALYLDQSFVAGIGNYLRSEILFDAGVDPAARPADLSRGQIGRLARSTLGLTRRALQTAGVTNPPRRVAALRRAGVRRNGYRFAVFDRDGEPCYACGSKIRRIEAGSRRLYVCDGCQPK